MKSNEAKCIICAKIYSLTDGSAYSSQFCHVRCLNEQRRQKEAMEKAEKKAKKLIDAQYNPAKCLYCKEPYVKDFHTRKYCCDACRHKHYAENKKEEEKPQKKKLTSHQINQRIEYARVKKNQGPSLKQYNAVRG